MLVDGDPRHLRQPGHPFFRLQANVQQLANRQPEMTFVFSVDNNDAKPMGEASKRLIDNLAEVTCYEPLPFELNSVLRQAFDESDKYPMHVAEIHNAGTSTEILMLVPRPIVALKKAFGIKGLEPIPALA